MIPDPSRGWDAIAQQFIAARSDLGADIVRQWATQLPPGAAVLDIGCGSGAPVAEALVAAGFHVFGVDASPTLVAEFRRRLPAAEVVCEPAETSRLFDRRFDGAVAIGLLFLLPADDQRAVIARVAAALQPGGRFLFSAPLRACDWTDSLTRQPSRSLGEDEYRRILDQAGLRLTGCLSDAGGNHYFEAARPPA